MAYDRCPNSHIYNTNNRPTITRELCRNCINQMGDRSHYVIINWAPNWAYLSLF